MWVVRLFIWKLNLNKNTPMEYMIFYTGLASTPNSVGLKCITTNLVVCEIETARPTGAETRKRFNKMKKYIEETYSNLL